MRIPACEGWFSRGFPRSCRRYQRDRVIQGQTRHLRAEASQDVNQSFLVYHSFYYIKADHLFNVFEPGEIGAEGRMIRMEGEYDVISLLSDTFDSGNCGAFRLELEKGRAERGPLIEGSLAFSLVERSERCRFEYSEGITIRRPAVCNRMEGESLGIYIWASEEVYSTFHYSI
jgi:hypothetical protein